MVSAESGRVAPGSASGSGTWSAAGNSRRADANAVYRFESFELRTRERCLLKDGVECTIGSRAFDVLVALLERRDRVVPRSELLDLAWPGLVVEENKLTVQISTLRKILGRHAISTPHIHRYKFALHCEVVAAGAAARAAAPPPPPATSTATSSRFTAKSSRQALPQARRSRLSAASSRLRAPKSCSGVLWSMQTPNMRSVHGRRRERTSSTRSSAGLAAS